MENKPYITIRILEIAGLSAAVAALRLPFGKECRSHRTFNFEQFNNGLSTTAVVSLNDKDLDLMQRLVASGDEHAKVVRGIMVWYEIDAPRYWWQEMDTYRVGTDRLSSESTMHIQGKGLPTDQLLAMKAGLTEGTYQKRVQVFSYQTLRRIYFQRRHHRLPHWQEFCNAIEALPYAKELITYERTKEHYGTI